MSIRAGKVPAAFRISVLEGSLMVLAGLCLLLGLAVGVSIFSGGPAGAAMRVLWMITAVAAGCCVAACLWALAWICRTSRLQANTMRRIVASLKKIPSAHAAAAAAGEKGGEFAGMSEVLEQLRELNVNVLLTEGQRASKRRYFSGRRSEELTRQAAEAAAAGRPGQAQQFLDELVAIAPDRPEIQDILGRVEQARREALSRDLAEARGRIDNLMAAADFDGAERVARELLDKYPAEKEPAELPERIRREREAFVNEQRLSMYRAIQSEATARRWRAARQAAEEMLNAFPDSPEADAVRAQMPTIIDNARLEEVRIRRDQIAELIERSRYREALQIAREVIDSYPQSAAAEDLRAQMERLEELAKSEGNPPR